MPFIGRGLHQLTQVTPGAQTWLAQVNADLQGLDETIGARCDGTAGEAITANDFVAFDSSDGKLYKTNPSGSNHRYNCMGMALATAGINTTVIYIQRGEVQFAHAWTIGTPLFLSSTNGQITNNPASGKLIGHARGSGKIWLACDRSWVA